MAKPKIDHKARELARLEARTDRYHLAQPVRESFRDDTAYANWELLFKEGSYTKARRHWFDVVEPATALPTD